MILPPRYGVPFRQMIHTGAKHSCQSWNSRLLTALLEQIGLEHMDVIMVHEKHKAEVGKEGKKEHEAGQPV